jgi:CDP-paratose 2-epimerase
MYKCLLVTGGAGFVGSSLAISLKRNRAADSVIVLDNLRRAGSSLNVNRLRREGIQFVHGDIRVLDDLMSLPRPGLIIECSAEPSVLAGYGGSPQYLINTNLLGCFHCLELARATKADFLFISTSRVYPYRRLNELSWREEATRFALSPDQPVAGASERGIAEDFPLDGARSLYGMTKLAAELMLQEYADAYGLRYIVNRCGLLTGPWQMAKSDQGVMALWVAAHYFKQPLRYIGFGGGGKQVRDFLHVDDLCDLVLDQIRNIDSYQGRIYNVGGGRECSLSLLETTALAEKITGNHIPISASSENRPADVRIYITDNGRVSKVNRWAPKRDAYTTLKDIHSWIGAEEATLRPVLLNAEGAI